MKLMLDTNVLARLCIVGEHADAKEWFRKLLLAPCPPELLTSVLADFELRRALQRKGASTSLAHFDEIARSLRFVPVSAEATRRASSLAAARPAGSQLGLSDGDAIMAAQALIEGAVLVTSDRSLRGVPDLDVRDWTEIDPSTFGREGGAAGSW